MIQSFTSVNPIESRGTQTKEFVLMGNGGPFIIAVLGFKRRKGN